MTKYFRSVLLVAALCAVTPSAFADEWRTAEGSREWSFPEDHGIHREFRTEWWYFTGQLETPSGRLFGYQLTFFRYGAARHPLPRGGAWAVRDLYAAHFALSDIEGGTFSYAERLSREGPGLSGGSVEGMDISLLDWTVTTEGGAFVLHAREGDLALDLHLRPSTEPLLHGRGGLSRKGGRPGQASWYYSLTDLSARGQVRYPGLDAPLNVRGWSWFDHEFGSNQLAPEQVGWDWFALRLGDGRRVMLYVLRRDDGGLEPFSSGTLREKDGTTRHLRIEDFLIEKTSSWKSEASGAVYPSSWHVRIPTAGVNVALSPLLDGQELITSRSTGITYWEGAVAGSGFSQGRTVTVEGYVELTGYGGSLGGLF